MITILLLIIITISFSNTCRAQDGYIISGKIDGITDVSIFLISDENDKPDTLGTTLIKNSVFLFSGKVENPISAYLQISDGKERIPLILENTNFMVNIGKAGALIKGGEQQEVFGQFTQINNRLLQEQERIQKDYTQAELSGNKTEMQNLMKKFEEKINTARQEEKKLIEKHSDMYVTAYVIALGIRTDNEENLRAKYELLGEKTRATAPGYRIAEALKQYEKLAVGEVAPNFTLEKLDGNPFTLHDISSKLKLINFWASTNQQCRQDNIELLKLNIQFRPQGLDIISISLDENKGDWRNASGLDGITWTNCCDLNGLDSEIARLYMVNYLPTTFLLDAENRVIAKDLQGNELRKKVVELLKKRKVKK